MTERVAATPRPWQVGDVVFYERQHDSAWTIKEFEGTGVILELVAKAPDSTLRSKIMKVQHGTLTLPNEMLVIAWVTAEAENDRDNIKEG